VTAARTYSGKEGSKKTGNKKSSRERKLSGKIPVGRRVLNGA